MTDVPEHLLDVSELDRLDTLPPYIRNMININLRGNGIYTPIENRNTISLREFKIILQVSTNIGALKTILAVERDFVEAAIIKWYPKLIQNETYKNAIQPFINSNPTLQAFIKLIS